MLIIGETYQKDLLMGESGSVYIAEYPKIYFVANCIEEALNLLCDTNFEPTLIGEMYYN